MNDKKISNYRISSQVIGKGAFSTVYLAYTQTQERVAVKIIPRQKIHQNQVKCFLNQINLLKKCHSPHIVKFIDLLKSKTNFYLFLEYCNEGNLQEYIKNKGVLDQKEAMDIFNQLVRGMNSMRKLNIIHRDIKPANIMFHDGKIKYVDFGLATKYLSQGEMMKTFVGSPFNMAPEIIHGKTYDDKVDIYSLGTVLYQMLYGVRPFNGSNYQQLIANIQSQKLNHPKAKIKVSSYVKQILTSMLAQNPQKRISYAQLVELVVKYEKYSTQKIVNMYKQKYRKSKRYSCLFGGIAAPLLGMYLTLQKSLWQKPFINGFQKQVDLNLKCIFDDMKCGGQVKQNSWDMDLRLCCNLYKQLYNKRKLEQKV